ncbi:MAG: hypothetical protein JXB40_03410 [Candidatus Omnitrophica bacterium]|nr:hypothetical protein [Candidatus Omnitrophota bacterium]
MGILRKIDGRSISAAILCGALVMGPLEMLSAAPSNGTHFPERGRIESGYGYNAMFKRPLSHSFGDLSTYDQFYMLTFGVYDWLAVDGQAGLGGITEKNGKLPTLEYNTGFAGGYGFRVKAFENKRWGARIIWGFQHISVHPCDRSINDDKYESFLDDWQLSAVAAKDFYRSGSRVLTAYAGIKGSDCEIVYKLNKHDKKRVSSDRHIGLITGLDIYIFGNKARVGVEGRFFDETALSASASYLF